MDGNFETLKQAFATAGINIKDAGYSITPYSLNTPLSFKFNNLDELIAFMELSAPGNTETINTVSKMVNDAGLDANSFFYVNFFKQKLAEL
jgi:hypothetical protein